MFDKTSRSVFEEGLRFYEEDILFDSHLYHANQKVYLELDYVKNGVGLIIGMLPNQPLEKQQLYYFIRIDHYSASLFLVNQMHYERLEHVSIPFTAPVKNFKICVEITSGQIVLNLNGRNYLYADLSYSIGDHHLGIYSQKDNTFTHTSVESEAPKIWRVNMQGAKNGRISFMRNEVRFSDCKYNAEILQENILLYPGTYYLNYEGEGVTPYVYSLSSHFIDLEHKNLLDENLSFVIDEQQEVAIYFSGRNGYVKNISLSRTENAFYIETYTEPVVRTNGYLRIKFETLKEAHIDFELAEKGNRRGYLFRDEVKAHATYIEPGLYTLSIAEGVFRLYSPKENIVIKEEPVYGNLYEILCNFDAFISRVILVDLDGETFDWFQRHDKVDWIKPSLDTPILATNDINQPLDLSASFRKVDNRYLFTNTERESFIPYPVVKLSKAIDSLVGVYGIPITAITTEASFYDGTIENPNDISAYCQSFEPITTCTYDKLLGQVIFHAPISQYREIIVDYKKQDSYCVNFVSELGMYSVQTTADHYAYYYSLDGQEVYANTPFAETEGYYVVLEKGDQ